MIPGLLSHLLQSTVFAGVAWLLTLALKKNRAQVRYWVWFAASVKFLAPLAVLVAAGSLVSWRTAPPPSAPMAIEQIAQPFGDTAPSIATRETAAARPNLMPELLLLVWACGFIGIVMRWGRRWARVHADMREAQVIEMG